MPRRAGTLSEYRTKRDFTRTSEPAGGTVSPAIGELRFVIQKHAASRLHFDLRLELGGVMKSWAVPKGPSTDPTVKRLAMEVEDHPVEYNTFEGTIPQGEYGGGTVMLWDRGTYTHDPGSGAAPDEAVDAETAIRAGYERGDLKVMFFGERMRGSYALVRMKFSRDESSSSKPQWLLIKHRDEFADDTDIVAENATSVDTGRTMDEITSGESRVGLSDPDGESGSASAPKSVRKKATKPAVKVAVKSQPGPASKSVSKSLAADIEPMYATVGTAMPGAGWTFEPKYDGIRVLAFVSGKDIRLVTRNGNDKAAQFPEIVDALRALSTRKPRQLVLDGEIVALTDGEPDRFQKLQSRMHVREAHVISTHRTSNPVAIVLFDLLASGDDIYVGHAWTDRRAQLLKVLGKHTSSRIRITESVAGDGDKMLALARKNGWEGIIAKRMDSVYEAGARSRAWLKLKIEFRQEFVVGGFTEPRNSRKHLGALLLGYFDRDRFIYVGHTGGGFTDAGLAAMYRKLARLERKTSPFEETPKTNEKAHWVKPRVIVEVKFSEWTTDGKLRQPIYLGDRDDKDPRNVGREQTSVQKSDGRKSRKRIYAERTLVGAKQPKAAKGSSRAAKYYPSARIIDQLDVIQQSKEGRVEISKDVGLDVTNLAKVFFPKKKLTKGDLMRYYTEVAPLVLPVVADRPLVLKRFPNGVKGQSFFQQNAGDVTPEGVRVETIETEGGSTNLRIVGGNLATLLYTVQLGAVSVDPWHARIQSLDSADYSILDLDPGPRAQFKRVVEVAGWVREVMDEMGLHGALKTSGSTGLHIYLPLPRGTPNEAATLVAQIIATRVTEAHPKIATIERSIKARGATTVYVDYLQNIIGKTVAAAYSARANPDALVSTPLSWDELTEDLDPREFTIETAPARFAEVGDIWGGQLRKKNSLRGLT